MYTISLESWCSLGNIKSDWTGDQKGRKHTEGFDSFQKLFLKEKSGIKKMGHSISNLDINDANVY